jgi:hypothetical protein
MSIISCNIHSYPFRILTTAEYCLETTQQLEGKLKEKVQPALTDKVDLGSEQDLFGRYSSSVMIVFSSD